MYIEAQYRITGQSPYSAGRKHSTPHKEKESEDAWEQRTWRERLHTDEQGHVLIPGMAFKLAVESAARYLSLNIKGKGKQTYTKNFTAGVLVPENLVLPVKAKDVACEALFVPSDGKRGGGRRVIRYFPIVPQWEGLVTFWILDPIITADVFDTVLSTAGKLVGIGRWRPANGGMNGRFLAQQISWKEN
jgi:hypothetical protein